MLNNELRELAIADKNEFLDNKTNILNILRMFKCDVEDYLNYIKGLSGTQYNRMQLVATQDEEVRIQEMQDEMVKLIDEITELLN